MFSGAVQKAPLSLSFRIVGLVGIFRFGVGEQLFAELDGEFKKISVLVKSLPANTCQSELTFSPLYAVAS